jgi:hypothetical protein
MACKKYREKIVLHLYGELSDVEAKKFADHIAECGECADELEYTKKVFQVREKSARQRVFFCSLDGHMPLLPFLSCLS